MTVTNPGQSALQQAIMLSRMGRNQEALAIIERLVAANDPAALALYAEMTWRGGMVQQDPAAGRDLFRRASDAGHAGAHAIYTNLLASGVAGPRDWPGALKRLKTEAKRDERRKRALALIERMRLNRDGDPIAIPTPEVLSEAPDAKLFPRLLTAAECDWLLAVAEPRYMPSSVHDAMGREVRDTMRTSDGAPIHWMIEDPAVHALNRRMAKASGTAFEQAEATQILRYLPGQQYLPHYDYVIASDNQRFLTLLVWLNDDYEGGETHFIETGLTVKGRKGDALLFRNMNADRSLDKLTKHAGLPVTRGAKYIVSKWIREHRWVP